MRKIIGILCIFIGLAGIGCIQAIGDAAEELSDSTTSTTTLTEYAEPTSLEASENGGYDTEDESEGFGLDSMTQYEEDSEVADPSCTGAEETDAEEIEGTDVYMIRVIWGNLKSNPGKWHKRHRQKNGKKISNIISNESSEVAAMNSEEDDFEEEDRKKGTLLDWTGTLSFTGDGLLLLKRKILFERHDKIIPETDKKVIEWESFTAPHIDGVMAKLIVKPENVESTSSVRFETDLVDEEILLSELDNYNEIVTVDDAGNGVAIIAYKRERDRCKNGFLQGRFHKRQNGEGGIFRGRYVAENGKMKGHLRGHYGEKDGKKLFFGKYISKRGKFKGILKGTYGAGLFDGTWKNRNGISDGVLDGKYLAGSEFDSGFFQGFWEEDCDEETITDTEETDTDTDDEEETD